MSIETAPIIVATPNTFGGGPAPAAGASTEAAPASTSSATSSADAPRASDAGATAWEAASPSVVNGTRRALDSVGVPRDTVFEAVSWLETGPVQSSAQLATIDKEDRASAELELRELWGAKFEGNVRAINKYLDSNFDPEVRASIRNARSAGGHALVNDPAVLQRLLGPARMEYSASGDEPSDAAGIDGEIAKIEKTMRTNRAAYNKDEKMQARYRSLLVAKETAK